MIWFNYQLDIMRKIHMSNGKIPQLGVALLLFNPNKDKILLAQRINKNHEGDRFGCPGGKVDFGENMEEAVLRECYEETHIKLELIGNATNHQLHDLYPAGLIANCYYPAQGNHFLCVWYYCAYSGPTPEFVEKNAQGEPKCRGWDWYNQEQIKTMPMMLSTLDAWNHLKAEDQASGYRGPRLLIKNYVRA